EGGRGGAGRRARGGAGRGIGRPGGTGGGPRKGVGGGAEGGAVGESRGEATRGVVLTISFAAASAVRMDWVLEAAAGVPVSCAVGGIGPHEEKSSSTRESSAGRGVEELSDIETPLPGNGRKRRLTLITEAVMGNDCVMNDNRSRGEMRDGVDGGMSGAERNGR
ncbi:MAG: hypothetical protein SGPRY_005911, partial [Prymnesium sp.]